MGFEDRIKHIMREEWIRLSGHSLDQRPAPDDWRCAVAALLVQDFYGGSICRVDAYLPNGDVKSHILNITDDGSEVDLTLDQFPNGTYFGQQEVFSREKLLSKSIARARYEELRQLVS